MSYHITYIYPFSYDYKYHQELNYMVYNKETIKEYHSMITKTMRKCRRN
jgi:hypothetical protein